MGSMFPLLVYERYFFVSFPVAAPGLQCTHFAFQRLLQTTSDSPVCGIK